MAGENEKTLMLQVIEFEILVNEQYRDFLNKEIEKQKMELKNGK